MTEAAVREAFAQQAAICSTAGAPFTGRLCRLIGERLDRRCPVGRRVLDWPGVPTHEGDALPLRLAGGLHALARSGAVVEWSALYPPNPSPSDEEIWHVAAAVLETNGPYLMPWLDGPPQTNEVGRSAALMAGLLVLADRFDLPFALYELGASAGLNTVLDRYGYLLGGVDAGVVDSPVRLEPAWTGVSPPSAKVIVRERYAVDRQPLDATDPRTRARLSAYVWADQIERLSRLSAALAIVALRPLEVDCADAADWLDDRLSIEPPANVCRVVMHTVAFQYFPLEAQQRIRGRLEAAGARARCDAPLGWLFLEAASGGFERRHELMLTTWPGGETRRLAVVQPHGATITWLDQAVATA